MTRFWKRDREFDELERELRARRSAAPPTFVRALAERATGESRSLRPRARVAVAAGLAVAALVAVASAGGFSAAQSTTHGAVNIVKKLATPSSSQSTVSQSPANQQYNPGKGCGDNNHLHDRKYQCKVMINDVKKSEGNSGVTTFSFTISLDNLPINTVTAVWSTANGTATAGSDYLPTGGTATFAPGVSTQAAAVSVVGDTAKEPNETFYVNITSVSGNAYIGDGQGLGTIVNDD